MERPTGNPHRDASSPSRPIYPVGATSYRPVVQPLYGHPAQSTDPWHSDPGTLYRQLDQLNRVLLATRQQAQQLQQQQEKDRHQIKRLRTRFDESEKDLKQSRQQVQALRQEFEHLATASLEEQRQLSSKHESEVKRQQLLVSSLSSQIANFESEVSARDRRLDQWQTAHDHLLNLSQWQLDQHDADRLELDTLQDELTLLEQEIGELEQNAAAEREADAAEIERLQASNRILSTDHETVELVNADLDHYCDELTSVNQQLHSEIDRLQALAGQLERDLLDERSRLSDELKTVQSLESERQSLRSQMQSLSDGMAEKQKQLDAANERAEHMASALIDHKRQIREMESSARAAQANAMLQASEAEQQFAFEREELETELQTGLDHQQHQTEKLQEQAAVTESLRSRLDEATQSLNQLEQERHRLVDERDELAARLSDSEKEPQQQPARSDPTHDRLSELAAYWREKLVRMEQSQLVMRERHHRSFREQQKTIVGLKEQLGESVRQRQDLQQQIRRQGDQIDTLQNELDAWTRYEHPIREAHRLSEQLAKQSARFAGERESLYRRIEQLQRVRQLRRAA